MLTILKSLIFPPLILFWLFCIPLALMIYTPFSYQSNCYWNERCARLGEVKTAQSIQDITRFFRHQQATLERPWTPKEFQHLLEVRGIYDKTFLVFILVSVLFMLDIYRGGNSRQTYQRYLRHSLFFSTGLVTMALLLIPFFKEFWMDVFHPLLFDNELWRTNTSDVSWYLMPKTFFLRAIIFICVTTLVLNSVLWWLVRR